MLSLYCLTEMRSCSKLRPFAVSARKAGGFSDLSLKMECIIMSDKLMCKASEIGKIIINKCLNKGVFINTQKLQKLLVLG